MRTCLRCSARYADDVLLCAADGEQLPDPDVEPGTSVGEYVIEGRLGAGAFGSVYKATHPLIGKRVAIKVLNRQFSSNPEMVSRFIAEARAVNQIGHRNIIDIFAFGQLPDGRQFYVMELLKGVTLERYVRERGRLMMQEAIPILRGVGRALDAAHKAGIAHRDLKPENVLVTNNNDDDGRAAPKLLDFGIAKLTGGSDAMHRTRTGTPMGTPYYMSPEQCRGRDVDHRTDIYSFGVMTYQVLTGALPFVGEDFLEIITQQVRSEAKPPSHVCADLPEAIDDAIAWMMRKDPAQRPGSLAEAVNALEQAAAMGGVSVHSSITQLTAEQRQALSSNFGLTKGGRSSVPVIKTQIGTAPPISGTNPPLGSSMVAAEIQTPPRAGRSKLVIALVAGVLAVGGIAIAAVATRSPAPSEAIAVAPKPEPPKPAPEPPKPAPAPEPPKPEVPATVAIKLEGTPGALIHDAHGDLLGTVPITLSLPRGDTAIELAIDKDGFETLTQKVTPSADASITVQLHAKPPKPQVHVPQPPPPPKKTSGLPEF